MLTREVIDKIEQFVYQQPRSVQEIAQLIGKNWRTADRYIDEIQKEYGTLATRTFRGGTRGALKIVYWASIEKASSSAFQLQLEKEILSARRKEDFSAFDLFQLVDAKKKSVEVKVSKDEDRASFQQLAGLYRSARHQLLIFSGNLSFLNYHTGRDSMVNVLDELVQRKISIKVLCRVDIAGKENIEKLLSLNFKHGREAVEIRHRDHPLRATLIDGASFFIKEIKEPTGKIHELDKKIFIYYTIKDKQWTEWLTRIFWKLFSSSIDAKKRLLELQQIDL